jgi:hypothetical protein
MNPGDCNKDVLYLVASNLGTIFYSFSMNKFRGFKPFGGAKFFSLPSQESPSPLFGKPG